MYQVISYIKFLLRSTNQHGVHSPFVYNFVTKCLYDKTNYGDYTKIKTSRNEFLESNSKRGTSLKNLYLLYRISKYFKLSSTLHLGTSLGIETLALAFGNNKNDITSILDNPEKLIWSKKNLEDLNITIINSDFKTAISDLDQEKYDCVFFNRYHNDEAILKHFNLLKHKAHNDSIFIFDSIYKSQSITTTWQSIIADNEVTVSIDTYNFGFVFFRKEQPKQHFTIRI